jgi:uncharacterized membrane protein
VVRELLALGFISFVPGWAVLPRRLREDGTAFGALSLALSLAIVTVASVVMLWLRVWRPTALFVVLGCISCARLVRRAARAARGKRTAFTWR